MGFFYFPIWVWGSAWWPSSPIIPVTSQKLGTENTEVKTMVTLWQKLVHNNYMY